MNPGKLRHRVTVESNHPGQTVRGVTPVDNWIPDFPKWASIEPLNGSELEYARQIVADATHKVTMRYSDEITTRNRLTYGSRVFSIDAIQDKEERRIEMTLLCIERT
jgi:SPP1 family predicted phage head-tail adaptor